MTTLFSALRAQQQYIFPGIAFLLALWSHGSGGDWQFYAFLAQFVLTLRILERLDRGDRRKPYQEDDDE